MKIKGTSYRKNLRIKFSGDPTLLKAAYKEIALNFHIVDESQTFPNSEDDLTGYHKFVVIESEG